ncbi:MAG: hypothetical protein D6812_13655 [Deltaproteobacteria bacterium]|nr:MAG: hypothetical protein D6812_13655 [Deltaproteobacteria bacterium]
METPEICEPKLLAEGDSCTIDTCSCGFIRIHVGAVTLRVKRRQFFDLFRTIVLAARAIAGEEHVQGWCGEESVRSGYKH